MTKGTVKARSIPRPPESMRAARVWLASLGLWLAVSYLLATLPTADSSLSSEDGLELSVSLIASLLLIGTTVGLLRSLGWLSDGMLNRTALVSTIALVSVLVVDNIYLAYVNAAERSGTGIDVSSGADAGLWHWEIAPRLYYPTERNFQLWRPNQRSNALVYGGRYRPANSRIPASMRPEVLQRRPIEYRIDELGFRETVPVEQAGVFALGDSFVFGWGSSQEHTWVGTLGGVIDRPVYNLGVIGTSPRQQLMMLEFLLDAPDRRFRVDHVLWMLFEGDDLEGSYSTFRTGNADAVVTAPTGEVDGPESTLLRLRNTVRSRSVINQLVTGKLVLDRRGPGSGSDYFLGNGWLTYPIYDSPRFGHRSFLPLLMERASRPRSYVIDHPNRPLLNDTVRQMKTLSEEHRFEVTVLLAPSAPRVYGAYYDGQPQPSSEPHLLEYLKGTSRGVGFEVVDLHESMLPFAEKELLYWRDDGHWNDAGNALVARLVAEQVFGNDQQ